MICMAARSVRMIMWDDSLSVDERVRIVHEMTGIAKASIRQEIKFIDNVENLPKDSSGIQYC